MNTSIDLQRRALHCYYTAREHRQQLDQRAYLRYETFKRIKPAAYTRRRRGVNELIGAVCKAGRRHISPRTAAKHLIPLFYM